MKAVILAGGLGTRISEETSLRPKPMVEIGGKPILWHVMKIYAAHGVSDFVICCGYKGYMIKEYFFNYLQHNSDMTIDLQNNKVEIHERYAEPWRVTLVDTGEDTMTGGRLKRVSPFLASDEPFCFTYGDGVGDIDVSGVIAYHKRHGRLATMTTTLAPGRFGVLELESDTVINFREKPTTEADRINGGFFVLSPKVIDYIKDDTTTWEQEPLQRLAHEGQLKAFKHNSFWQPMDTLREKNLLEQLWKEGRAPWKVWE
jgi:glucose-1-phosphate cytidylyltransferase